MKSQYTLQQLAARITERSEKKEDFIADTRAVEYNSDTNSLVLDEREFKVNDHCHGQIATQLDIPSKYYQRMREHAPGLLADNIHEWFRKYPTNRMLRTLDHRARAWLSDKFNRMDDDAFANVVLPSVYEVPGAQVESCGLTDIKTTIKFVSPRLERQVKVGDLVQFGIAFSNSEVGAGRLSGALFAKQLRCLNGMVIEEEMFASTHVGKRHTSRDLGEIFQLDTLKADGAATILKLRDFAKELLTDRFLDQQVERMRGLTETRIETPVKAVEHLAKQHSFTEATKNDVLKHLIEGGDLSLWGLQNAVTRAAADQEDYDDATRLETLGGRMLTLPKADYTRILQAA
jgi:hypothetical protein